MVRQGTIRHRALTRTLRVAARLQSGRHTLQALASEFGVSKRTIRRDVEVLSLAGYPVRNTADATAEGLYGFWWMSRVCPHCRARG